MNQKQQIKNSYVRAALIADSYKYVSAHGSYHYYPFGEYMRGRYATDTASNCITTTLETLVPGYFDRYMSYADMAGLPYSQYGTITEFDTTAPMTVITGGGGVTLGGGGSSVITVGGTTPPAHAVFLGTSGIGSGVSIPIHAAAGADHIIIDVYSFSMVPAYAGMLYEVTDGTSAMVGNIASPLAGPITIPLTTIPHSTDLQLSIFGEDPGDYVIITGIHIPHDTTTAYNIVATVCNNDFYRYGFNGKQKDNEWAGLGNHYDYGMRPYDPRIGRPPIPDPLFKKYPSLTPYQFFSNNPIQNIDLDGAEGVPFQASINGVKSYATQNTYVKPIKAYDVIPAQPSSSSGLAKWLRSVDKKFENPSKDKGTVSGFIIHNKDGISDNFFNENNPAPGPGTQTLETSQFAYLFGVANASGNVHGGFLEGLEFLNNSVGVADAIQNDPNLPKIGGKGENAGVNNAPGNGSKSKADTFKFGNTGEAMLRDTNGQDSFVPLKSLPEKEYENNCKNCTSK